MEPTGTGWMAELEKMLEKPLVETLTSSRV